MLIYHSFLPFLHIPGGRNSKEFAERFGVCFTTGFHGIKPAVGQGNMVSGSFCPHTNSPAAGHLSTGWVFRFCSSQGSEGPHAITTETFLEDRLGKHTGFAFPPSYAGWHLGGIPFLKVRFWKQLLLLPQGWCTICGSFPTLPWL